MAEEAAREDECQGRFQQGAEQRFEEAVEEGEAPSYGPTGEGIHLLRGFVEKGDGDAASEGEVGDGEGRRGWMIGEVDDIMSRRSAMGLYRTEMVSLKGAPAYGR